MAESAQSVSVVIADERGVVTMTLRSTGVGDVPITLDPQAASELSEKLALAAHNAQSGSKLVLLPETPAHMADRKRPMLVRRLEVMLNSLRYGQWSNKRLAEEMVDTVMTKVV